MGGMHNARPAIRYDLHMPSGLKRYQGQGSDHAINFSCYQRLPYLDTDHAKTTFETELEKLRLRHQFTNRHVLT
jgi:hypothetical protein